MLPAGTFQWQLPIVVGDVACNGSENSLLDCSVSQSGQCISGEGAAIVCQGKALH